MMLTLSGSALAVPGQIAHQGRLLDAEEIPLEGGHTLTFRLYNDLENGDILWEETHTVEFENGFYSLRLGADEQNNPLEDWFTGSDDDRFLELAVNSDEALTPRLRLDSVPYAITSTHVDGGSVNATEIRVGGELVVDSGGQWVGVNPTMTWEEIVNVPQGFGDGDDADALLALSCNDGEIAAWDAGLMEWMCAIDWDSNLTESDVETYITNDAVDLASGTTLGGSTISTGSHTTDTNLSESEVEAFVINGAVDLASGTTLGGSAISTGAHTVDTDTHLAEAEVETFITNGSIDLNAATTLGGATISTGAHTTDHSSTSDGLDITPASVTIQGTSTALTSGELDLGPNSDDLLTAAMVQTLTGGGDADALHTHAGAGGGVCYTAWGTTGCGTDFTAMYTGRAYTSYIAQRSSGDPITGNGSGALGTTICAQTPSSESSTSSSANRIYFGRSTKYKSSFNCAVCCK